MRIHRKLIVSAAVILAAISAWAQTGPSSTVNLPPGSAVISDLKGDVSVTAPQQSAPIAAQKGQLLGPNTTLEAKKGSALLLLADGSQVLVKANTRVILRIPDEARGNFLEQLIGSLVAKVKKRTAGEPPFKMGTPTAVITVRGTKFLVEVTNKQKTLVWVYEGVVEVEGFAAGGHPVYLQPGYATQVGRNAQPDDPRRPLDMSESEGFSGTAPSKSTERDAEQRSGRQSGASSGGEGPD